jgi:membrane fusion protein, multidrug efflux system
MTGKPRRETVVPEQKNHNSYRATGFCLLTLFLAACGSGPAQQQNQGGGLPVSYVTVERKDVPLHGEWVGTMDGFVNAQIQPQVTGYLVEQTYREGSPVSKDQVLFQIDPRPFQAVLDQAKGQLAQAKGQVAQADAQMQLAQINVDRDTPLAARKAIAQSQLDDETQQLAQTKAAVQSAQAQVTAAEAAVETASINLGFTHVRSLISGVAGQASIQVGNLVSPQSVLTSVSQLNPIKVYFSISDSEYLALIEAAHAGGGDLLKGSAKVPLTLVLSNGQTFPQQGRILYVDRQMDQQTGAIRIVSSFPNPTNVLRPGQFGRVSAPSQIQHNALLVPQVAVQELQGTQQLYTITSDNKVKVTNVKLGPQVGSNMIIIESGISEGTKIITDNLQKLKDGSPVSPHAAEANPPANSNNGAGASKAGN